jgi:hypothetical protein
MKALNVVSIALLGLVLSSSSFALDKEQQDALKDTDDLLTNQQRLDAFAKENPDAKNALGDVKKLTGGDPKAMAEVNAISSSVFQDLVKGSGGDEAAVMQKLQEGLKNPAAFMQNLSPEQRARIQKLGAEIDAKNAKGGSHAPASVK